MELLAVLSDVHGNVWALKEVLKDVAERGADRIINLGDTLYGPLAPLETWDVLRRHNIRHISGNGDRALLEAGDKPSVTLEQNRRALNADIEAWLKSLPKTFEYGNMLFCHGTPFADDQYLLERIDDQGVVLIDEAALTEYLSPVRQTVVFCGHSHVPRIAAAGAKTIVNVGSVGLPAYRDSFPRDHRMESQSPAAKYALAALKGDMVNVEIIEVEYDHEAAAGLAERNGRPDWAFSLRTGRAQ